MGTNPLRLAFPYDLHSPAACIPIRLLLPYRNCQPRLLLQNKSPINSVPVYSNRIFYCPVRTIPYSSYSRTAFTPLQELMAISSTPLRKLISYSLRFSAAINTRFLRRLTAFNSLRELTLISSTPLWELTPYSFRSPVPGSTSDSPTPLPTAWVLLPQE